MGSLQKNIQLMLEFVKAPLLVRHFSFHTLMTFMMMLSVILLSMVMILLSTRKCNQSSDLWQQLELAPELESDLRDTGLLISVVGKLSWFRLTGLITQILLI